MSEQTATERLRELLDERGEEWVELVDPTATAWTDGTHGFIADEDEHGKLELKTFVTPEQAIAETLGREKCLTGSMAVYTPEQAIARVWFTCGHDCMVETLSRLPNYCPVCGRKVVAE